MIDNKTKKQLPGILRFLIKLFQIILYIPIQIIFIPFAIIGLIIAIYKEMGKSKKLGISFSAIKALQYRWMMHYFNTRPDPLSVAFTKKFPCESHYGMWSILGALIISQRLFSFPAKLGKFVEPGEETLDSTAGIRVHMFDRIMEKYVDEIEQIVLPGVGFDLIALHFTKGKKVKVFELDQVNTLNVKVETLKKAGIKHDWITYIPVDYANESWVEKLLGAGFDKTRKTLFLWQSVSLYLEADIVKETLRKMADLCVDGSIIAQDFYSKAFALGEYSKTAKRFMGIIEKMGEPSKFGIDMSDDPREAVESFLRECGLKMTNYIQFGEKLDIEPFYCIVEAEVRPHKAGMTITEQKEIVRKGYDKLSYAYRSDNATDDEGFYTEWVNCLKDKIAAGSPVLDLGCGCGLPATKLLSEFFKVTGVDFSEVQIERARKLVPAAEFICSDIADLQFSNCSFAAVVSFYTIIHIPLDEHREILMRIADWLSPNGYLLIIVGHEAWTGSENKYLGVEGGEMMWSHEGAETYTQWISETGLRILWTRFIPEGESGHTLVLARKSINK